MSIKQLIFRLSSNVFTNWFLIHIGAENWIRNKMGYWRQYKTKSDKSDQENAGYSHLPEIQQTVDETHTELTKLVNSDFKNGANVLDIGCGTGLYLSDFNQRQNKNSYNLSGIDLSVEMLEIAKKNVVNGNFTLGDFLDIQFQEKFNIIISVGAFQYIARGKLKKFFGKIHKLLEDDGVFFLSYPHAISKKDLFYPDLTYMQYSPTLLNKLVSGKFDVINHFHSTKKVFVGSYDTAPFIPQQFDKSYFNSSIFVLRKK